MSVGPLSIGRDPSRITLFAVGVHASGIAPDPDGNPPRDLPAPPPRDLILARLSVR